MAEQVEDIILDGASLAGYEMKEGGDGPAGVYKNDGHFMGLLSPNFKFGPSKFVDRDGKEQTNTWINIGIVTQDEDEKGKVVYGLYNLEGEQTDGPNKGRKNLATLHDLCVSAGRMDLAAKLLGKFSVKDILTQLTVGGQTPVFFRAQTRMVKEVMRTEPRYFIKKDRYEASKKSGTNWRVEPRAAKGTTGTRAGNSSNGVSHGAGATPATDALATDV